MIKKTFIIFAFILIIFNMPKVNAASNEEKNLTSSLNVVIWDAKTLADLKEVKISLENAAFSEPQEFVTNNRGQVRIKNLCAGETIIRVLDAGDEYILPETEYKIVLEENKASGYRIKLKHKTGGILIKCHVPNMCFKFESKGWYGTLYADEKGEIYVNQCNTGTYRISQKPFEGYDTMEPVEIEVKENEIYEIVLNETEELPDEEKETERTEEEDDDKKVEEEDNKTELDNNRRR